MLNLILLSVGTVVYYFVFSLFGWKPKKTKGKFLKLTVIFFLCMPFNFNGDVYTVLGNGESEKGFYSLISFYQEANNAPALTWMGISFYQSSTVNCKTPASLSFYKEVDGKEIWFNAFQ